MSTLKNKAYPIFQKPPCEENSWISFDDEAGCIKAYPYPSIAEHNPDLAQRGADARNSELMAADARIKETFGKDHFHGEMEIPLSLAVRELIDQRG